MAAIAPEMPAEKPTTIEGVLEDFKQLSELYRFYLGLVLQTVTFALGVSGAVFAYVLKQPRLSYRLCGVILPALLCLGMGVGFLRSVKKSTELRKRLKELAQSLGFAVAPHAESLSGSLLFFGWILISVAVFISASAFFVTVD